MKTCVPVAPAERRDDIVLVEARASMKSSVCIDETETRGKIFTKVTMRRGVRGMRRVVEQLRGRTYI